MPYFGQLVYSSLIKLPTTYHHRGFEKNLPGITYEWNNGRHRLDSHNTRILYLNDFYKKSHTSIAFLTEGDEGGYNKFKDKILAGIS